MTLRGATVSSFESPTFGFFSSRIIIEDMVVHDMTGAGSLIKALRNASVVNVAYRDSTVAFLVSSGQAEVSHAIFENLVEEVVSVIRPEKLIVNNVTIINT